MHPKRKLSRQQLRKNLELLGSLSDLLPPNLPPSPPSSRSSSPAPGSKRKPDSDPANDHIKRPRTSEALDRSYRNPPSQSVNSNSAPRSDPCEEGELRDDPTPSKPHALLPATPSLPIQRPRKNLSKSDPVFEAIHDRYHNYGRMLKYSGDTRFWSTYSPSHKEYKPLIHPPPVSSPYHKHGALMARLELLDALICFTYAIWSKDFRLGACLSAWPSTQAYLNWTKMKWAAESSAGEREKALLGLIYMIEAFIHSRMFVYCARQTVEPQMEEIMQKARVLVESAAANDASPGSSNGTPAFGGAQATPPMLPSPASIAPANSANSTPTGRGTGTPTTTINAATVCASAAASASTQRPPTPTMRSKVRFELHTPPPPIASSINLPITAAFAHSLQTLSHGVTKATLSMRQSQQHLTLRTLAVHFPVTFARIVHSSLSQSDEFEPDMEDEEGELFWPGAPETGEGLGWVCLMGKAMIKEFGKDIGYLGYEGIVRKPETSTPAPPASVPPRLQSRR
ncbi:hypothetical protein DENSPDRAFT_881576 [Dentipellis sp. KUC8613]|nr:hypothetical protein DENSPDRAFT_881576 [Dentipellis sp. KUC8613]